MPGTGRAVSAGPTRESLSRLESRAYPEPLDQTPMPSRRRPTPDRGAIWVAMLVLYLVWGSTYLGIAIAVETIPPFVMAAIRFVIAGLVLLGWSAARSGWPPSRFLVSR